MNVIYNAAIRLEPTLPESIKKAVSRAHTFSQFLFSHDVDARLEKYLWGRAILPGIADATKVRVMRVSLYILFAISFVLAQVATLVTVVGLYALYRGGKLRAEEIKQAADAREEWNKNQPELSLMGLPSELRVEIGKRIAYESLGAYRNISRQVYRETKTPLAPRLFLHQAMTIFQKYPMRGEPCISLTQAFAKRQEYEKALACAHILSDTRSHPQALAQIAIEKAKMLDIVGAQEAISTIHEYYQIPAKKEIAKAQVKTDDLAGATATANSFNNPYTKDEVQAEIVKALAEKSNIDLAKVTANLITGILARALALVEIAKVQIQNEKNDDAKITLAEANALFALIQDSNQQVTFLIAYAQALRLLQDMDGAKAALARVIQIVELIPNNNLHYHVLPLTQIAEELTECSDHEGAKGALEKALARARLLPNKGDNSQALALLFIARAYAINRDYERALQCVKLISSHKSEALQALLAIVEVQCTQKEITEAKKTMEMINSFDEQERYKEMYQVVALGAIAKAEGNGAAETRLAIRSIVDTAKERIARTDVYYGDAARKLDTWELPGLFIEAAEALSV